MLLVCWLHFDFVISLLRLSGEKEQQPNPITAPKKRKSNRQISRFLPHLWQSLHFLKKLMQPFIHLTLISISVTGFVINDSCNLKFVKVCSLFLISDECLFILYSSNSNGDVFHCKKPFNGLKLSQMIEQYNSCFPFIC